MRYLNPRIGLSVRRYYYVRKRRYFRDDQRRVVRGRIVRYARPISIWRLRYGARVAYHCQYRVDLRARGVNVGSYKTRTRRLTIPEIKHKTIECSVNAHGIPYGRSTAVRRTFYNLRIQLNIHTGGVINAYRLFLQNGNNIRQA